MSQSFGPDPLPKPATPAEKFVAAIFGQHDDISIFDDNDTRMAKLRAWSKIPPVMALCYGCNKSMYCTRVQVADDTGLTTAMVCDSCFDGLPERDYNVCNDRPDGIHGPVEQMLDMETPPGTVAVRCGTCGITTSFTIPDKLEWN